jgi:hypothetical protein
MPLPAMHVPGFVIALRARLWRPGLPAERHWLIASRWGAEVQFLSVAFAGSAERRGTVAPPGIAPRRTLLALAAHPAASAYTLADRPLPSTSLAGTFLPARGTARLGAGSRPLRLVISGAHGDAAAAGCWQPFLLRAVCADWPDQFIEPAGR